MTSLGHTAPLDGRQTAEAFVARLAAVVLGVLLIALPAGARSGRAVGLLRKAGYANAVALSGGTAAWRDANLPIEKKG